MTVRGKMKPEKHLRNGQALMELAVGMFALALVVSALCAFATYVTRSLKMQNSLRTDSSTQSTAVDSF